MPRPLHGRVGQRGGREQRPRVRVRRPLAHIRDGAGLHQPTAVQNGDAIGHVPDDREIVADEEVAQRELALQGTQQVEDLGLDGQVECADRLVADKQPRRQHECARDRDALQLPTGEMGRKARRRILIEADAFESGGDFGLAHGPLRVPMGEQRFFERLADRSDRVERALRVLKDRLDITCQPPALRR